MRDRRRFSEALSEGDGISVIAEVDSAASARQAEADGAEALLVYSGNEGRLDEISAAASLPILFYWDGQKTDSLGAVDACIISVRDSTGSAGFGEALGEAHTTLGGDFELAFRIEDDEELSQCRERFDPEIFVLAAPSAEREEAFEHVLDLLPDVPAGKLAIAEIPAPERDDVVALERAGMDGVIVASGAVAGLVGGAPPEV